MGTPEFAVASLAAIYDKGHEIAAVVTVPDKPAGRGQQLRMSEVKQFALSKGLPVLQPDKLKDPLFLETLRKIDADLFIVVAFRILPEEIFQIPRHGTFNLHASLLPDYRGAAPIHRAVMNGDTITGVTTFFLNREMDKGDIIAQRETVIGEKETTGELYHRLMSIGAELTLETISLIQKGEATPFSQSRFEGRILKPAPKIFKEDTLIDWEKPARQIFNKIRGLSPFPGAYTRIGTVSGDTLTLKCYRATVSDRPAVGEPGQFETDSKNLLAVNTADFQIFLENVQLQGKAKMDIQTFLRGFRPENFTNVLF